MRLRKYLVGKTLWYIGALFVALVLNFLLPRLMPGNPVDAIIAQPGPVRHAGRVAAADPRALHARSSGSTSRCGSSSSPTSATWPSSTSGRRSRSYPASVSRHDRARRCPWTIALQLPAILIGWVVGNTLGALAAYKGGWFDRGAFLSSLFLSSMPYYCLAIMLLYLFAVALPMLPPGGGYSPGTTPAFCVHVLQSTSLRHYWLPFFSLVLIFIGGQAVGMRSMAIYELNSDYVNYGRGLGLPDKRIVRYIFRNAMLPQVTGLALSIGTLVGGALITEIVFSYPGIGTMLFSAISQNDYPVIQAITLLILVAVLVANFLVEIAYGFIDPRIRAAQAGER